MANQERAKIEALVSENDELKALWEEHLELERQLDEMNSRGHLSPTEQLARTRIKKKKLAGKDQIARILAANGA